MADNVMSPPKKKKLPFKPTALRRSIAKPSPAGRDDDGLSLFSRAKEMAPIVAADQERRMKRAQKHRDLETKAQDQERRSSAGEKRPFEEDEGHSFFDDPRSYENVPRRADTASSQATRSSPAVQSAPHTMEDPRYSPPSKRSRHGTGSSKRNSTSIEEAEVATFDASPSTQRLRSRRGPEVPIYQPRTGSFTFSGAPVISLDSDSDEDVKPIAASLRRRSPSISFVEDASPRPSSPPEPAEDDEFAEYVLKAEQQRAKDRAMLSRGAENGSRSRETTEILVTSTLPDTKTLLVKFIFDKPLRIIRETWIAKQRQNGIHIPLDQVDDVVLTWRRRKVYNYSTLLSLGIRPHADGRLVADAHGSAGLVDSSTKVHLEAWTPDLFQDMEREEDLRRKREAGELSDEDEPELALEPETKIKVILKARDLDDVKLSVRPETTVETLVTGFRTQRDVTANRDISLWFDGERLEEHVTMDEAEIDDMDTIEVHIK
ncbi:ubiquitin-2 like Rad60 SUMO-like-domain-containing protein [Dactylonectria estremocensis]|uniref:Ubiquitin-2 like Rad60 SUMO-like-domain-containing protein n=1 Tax=Dactylonectria estremocensis TaxID=1079267 RepID=A0A9P9FLA1_9HYPO|nr:ubiquitin-2 like Rad60 SUMO-like-domain-containing protein [Dactylonectria estremocensis]